jgi:DNA invertase Pin-like site-specific DNA recombinase
MNGEVKISNAHRDRLAVIYLRQSSMAQVREHTESTTRQYGLAEVAVALGWARADVLVIDTDLGVSGRWGVAREGFTELVSRVCSGEVGAIFGIEISRLARSNAEVARLMEFAAITQTLLIDADGIYDPGDINDRMLLGMKSTIGEVELHVMAQRLAASKKAAAERGELRTPLPVGYVHDQAGEVVIDPDAEVQAAIGDLFAAFAACGSAYGVVAAFTGRRFPLRAYGGAWAGQLRWGRLTHARVLGVLKNPCYAGAYVHGRYTSRRTVEPDGTVRTGLVERPRAQWPVLIHDHHEGYLTWADYLANETKLAANRTNAGARPPAKDRRCVRGSSPADPAANRCAPTTTPTSGPPTNARAAPMRSPPRPADPSQRPQLTQRWPTGCCRRSIPPRSPSPWPPPTTSPIAISGSAEPPSSPSNAPATRLIGPNAPSARWSRRTGWSPTPWRPGGKPNSPLWPKPSKPSPPPRMRYRPYPPASSWRNWPPTCPDSGRRPRPAIKTANGCCAP